MGDFTFNGVSASSMGLVVERFPAQHTPRKRLTTISIPGRSGDLHQWDGGFENFTQQYVCWFKSSPVSDQAHRIKQWLLSAPAASRLEDTYDSSVYHLATYQGGAEIENSRDRFGRFTVEFDCASPAYLKSGDAPVTFAGGGVLTNPSAWASLPLLVISGSVSGVVKIGGTSMTIRFVGYDDMRTLYVDSDSREAWELADGERISRNDWVASQDFPSIDPGDNAISMTGGIKSVAIYPRWWTV